LQGVSKEDLEKAGASLQAAAASSSTSDEPAQSPVISSTDRLSTATADQRSMSLTDEVSTISCIQFIFCVYLTWIFLLFLFKTFSYYSSSVMHVGTVLPANSDL
jgi:hypothetical protein